jgi:hypothetical protein
MRKKKKQKKTALSDVWLCLACKCWFHCVAKQFYVSPSGRTATSSLPHPELATTW